jgi:hypothetical protein
VSTYYILANFTKKECLEIGNFAYAPTQNGILSTPTSARVALLYLFHNRGDAISMVSDEGYPILGINEDDAWRFRDVTDEWKQKLDQFDQFDRERART